MKIKILILIILFTLFILPFNAKAAVNNGKLYEEYWQEAGVNVFATSSTGTLDYLGWMIKSTTDSRIYYCIEPEIPMQGKAEAVTGTHNIYTNSSDIINNSRLTNTTKKRIELLAYYGYMYGNHTSKKWYGITQIMIWRTIRSDIKWTFREGRYSSSTNANLWKDEVTELEDLVSKHNIKPSFDSKNIKLTLGNNLTINDTNGVLENFSVTDNEYASFKISGNSLTINPKKVGKVKIPLTKKNITSNAFALLSGKTMQDLVLRGNVTHITSEFEIEVEGGTLELTKLDYDNNSTHPSGSATLKGAKYGIYDVEKNLVAEIITNNNAKASIILPFGKYILKEIEAPVGYNLDLNEYPFEIDENNLLVKIDVKNVVIKGIHKIIKYKGGTGEEFIFEENAQLRIEDEFGNEIAILRTNNNGEASITLPYGKYNITQIAGDFDYAFVDSYTININNENQIIKKELKNIKFSKLIFTKKDYASGKSLPNTLIEIYNENDELVLKDKTNELGQIEFENLNIGKYYIIEIEAPKYYKLNEEKLWFEVLENGQIIKLEMLNERKIGKLIFLKIDSRTKLPLANTKIEIYDNLTNELVFRGNTNEKGLIEIDEILAGSYYILEKKASNGYKLFKDKLYFEIIEDQEIKNITMKNDKEFMPKTNYSAKNLIVNIIAIITLSVSLGFIFYIFILGKKNENK